ncbi:hypothetical protein tb265_29310 [Gemmatimonadetes bacterium T265]|nr:hypothetical protein tb265_29310 [Gemmatimonadetes bacterium T265]
MSRPRSTPRSAPNVRRAFGALALAALALAAPGVARAQPSAAAREVLVYADDAPPAELFGWLDVVTGTERAPAVARRVGALLPGWTQDALGSWTITRGRGAPHRVVACALDRPAYVVSEITDDGYLRLHDPAAGRAQHPLWDQFHEGQRVRVRARADTASPDAFPGAAVPGVVGVRSTHLYRRRAADSTRATVDAFYVDVGARSRAEAESLGVRLLAPVTRDWAPLAYGASAVGAAAFDAGPVIAQRVGCAAVAAASRGTPAVGRTTFVAAAQSAYANSGLAAVLARVGPVDSLVLVEPGDAPSDADTAAVVRRATRPAPRAVGVHPASAVVLGVRARFPGTLVESVRRDDGRALVAAVARAAGVGPAVALLGRAGRPRGGGAVSWDDAVAGLPTAAHPDSLAGDARLLAGLADAYGASAHEAPVRDAVRAALPAWARDRATVDSAGNLVVAAGPDRDSVAIVAHLDEIGFAVTRIARDGTVALRPLGGFYRALWEGQPALLHRDGAAPLAGVFVPRDTPRTREPAELTAWFGVDSAALARLGVRPGAAVTGVKRATRLGAVRFTARSSDDRTGCAALVLAMRALDPARLTHKVVFAFTTREEIGLEGAAALAAEWGANVRRVYAVDTFVASDAPLESHRFAYTPLGAGAVVRAVDNSSAAPLEVVDEVVAVARAAGIPVQVGTTNGGNDGSEFARVGVVDVPLSWPGRYSHSPVEVLDLRDLRALARLIAALAAR